MPPTSRVALVLGKILRLLTRNGKLGQSCRACIFFAAAAWWSR
jgi:hypothetical protein